MGKASREKKARKAQKWELLEKAVRLLEHSLLPNARVERDQELPNHKTAALAGEKPLTRQCDVVIYLPGPHGETFWIVEVQKRGRNVEQKDYDAWVSKMDQVGAAGLIGVAEKGFPRSAILDAKTRGPRVKLFTLSELEGTEWPVRIVGNEVILSGMAVKLNTTKIDLITTKRPLLLADAPLESRVFRRADTGASVTGKWLSQMASRNYRHLYHRAPEGTIPDVVWDFVLPPEWRIQMQHEQEWLHVTKMQFVVDLIVKYYRFPLTVSGYKPVEMGPIKAYTLTASGPLDGKDAIIRIVVRKDPDGRIRVLAVEFEGFPDNSLVEFGFSTEKPGPVAPPSATTT